MQIYNPPFPILILAFQAFYIKWPTSLLKNVSYQDYLLTAKNDCNIAKYIMPRSCELRFYNILERYGFSMYFILRNCSDLLWEKTFETRDWRPRICKIFEITIEQFILAVKGQNNFW